MITKILAILDNFLCAYLGLYKHKLMPHAVKRKGGKIMVLNTESFKRHGYEIPVSEMNFSSISKEDKEKIGLAMGKVIATHLVISFDEITIRRENTYAK